MRASPIALLLLPLFACTGSPAGSSHVFDSDTGSVCGRVRGSSGILLYENGGDTVRVPTEAPSTTVRTTGVAGPVGAAGAVVAVTGGTVLASADGGCNWDDVGSLPATGVWSLVAGGADVYAFDGLTGAGAVSADGGASWTPFDTVEPFLNPPAFADGRLRGVQARGVVTSDDRGVTWTLTDGLPFTPVTGAANPALLDLVVIGGPTGVAVSHTGGTTWEDVSATLVGVADGVVSAVQVAPSPADAAVLFALTDDADGLRTVQRSADGGATWDRLGDSAQVTLGDDARLYPLPDDATTVLSNSGVPADAKLNLYRITAGAGIHTVSLGGYLAMPQLSVEGDRWVAAVHAVP